jgi:hypothetical protein
MQLPYDARAVEGDAVPAQPISLRGKADGAGSCTLTSSPVPEGRRWLVYYVTVTTSGSSTPNFDLFVDSAQLPNLLDGTADGSGAVADYQRPRVLTQGQVLVGVWTGATSGDVCSLRVEYDVQDDA